MTQYSDERWLRIELAKLHREYQDKAKPIVDALVAIEASKPPGPILIPLSEIPDWLKQQIKEAGRDD